MGNNNTESTLFLVLILVAVLVGAYYTTKFLSKKATGMAKSKHIQIIDRMGLAKDKALFLTKVGGRYFFIGITNQTISNLGEIEPGEIENLAQEEEAEKGFLGKFSDFLINAKNAPDNLRKAREQQKKQPNDAPPDSQEPPRAQDTEADGDYDDYINQLSRKIEQRKGRARSTPRGEGK